MSGLELRHPETIDEVASLLAEHGGARCLSGGATLVAMMNAGLVHPSLLISLNGIEALKGIHRAADGTVRIGAMTRHAETAASTLFHEGQRIVPIAAGRIANVPVRNMGTIGGSLSFADPAADYLTALTAAAACVETASVRGRRTIPIGDFVSDWYTTVMAEDEIVTAVVVPPAAAGSVAHYEKLDRVSGDFAIVSIALVIAMDGDMCRAVRIAVGGCGPKPLHSRDADEVLEGAQLDPTRIVEAGARLVAISDPVDDVRASADYRRKVLPRLLAKSIAAVRDRRAA
jgi:carbon-monoxide dehydrogenase medium subunit